ncbi:MAG: bifunctional diaminohydroxyphosphoribosylaminopyrimidine [Bacteroidota bacterium]
MRRCLELAESGSGHVAPNPMVGCVIVQDGAIIGEGWHRRYGDPHAEVNAIAEVISRHGEKALQDSTLYVNLEPCSHFGKTPPCADLLIARRIPRVVVCNTDPYEKVKGSGIQRLKDAGIEVLQGVMEKEGAWLNRRFFTFHTRRRPYILLKFAQTSDGFIAPDPPDPSKRWISGSLSRKLVHKWRSEESGIMVGSTTALNDNPDLTVREWSGKNPVRIVIDREGRLPRRLNLFNQDVPTLVFTTRPGMQEYNLEHIQVDPGADFTDRLFDELHRRRLLSVMVEGGKKLLELLLRENKWDEARIFTAPHSLNAGIEAPEILGKILREETIGNDRLTYLVRE